MTTSPGARRSFSRLLSAAALRWSSLRAAGDPRGPGLPALRRPGLRHGDPARVN